MELKRLVKKLSDLFLKYRFVVLVLVIGLVFMVLPTGSKSEAKSTAQTKETTQQEKPLADRLSELLSKVQGAGRVTVLLTEGEGEQTVYQTDTDISTREDDTTERKTTVTVDDAQRNQVGLVQQVNPPRYLGAVVLCEGADDPTVQLSVTEAVSKATGLGTNRISVLKMK